MVRRHRSAAAFGRVLVLVGVALGVALAGQAVRPPTALAATLTVSSTADVASNFGACGGSSTTPTGGSLREAICAANNAGATTSTINVPAGTYILTNGELQMGKVSGSTITLNGAGAGSTIIDGNGASRVFDLDPSILGGVTTSISGVTITNGAVTTFGGAGIIAGSGHATTKDTLTISNATITNNHVNTTTSNKPGGGVQFEGGSLSITNSTISNNSSGSSPGGGVSYTAEGAAAGEQLAISGTTFSGNQVDASVANVNMGGGALDTSMSSGSSPTFTVTNSRFINNTVTGSGTGIAHGGAIFSQTGPLSVTGSTFTGNSVTGGAAAYGGAISVTGNAPTLHYNRFTGNVGASGSAVAIPYANGATVDATDNWWGCNTGPGTTGCDTVFGGPTVSPRLVLSATASPATVVGPNASSTITAALTRDSLGAAIGAANLDAFAGLPVSFTDPLPGGATLGAASANLSSGAASTTYNSQNSGGPGHVLATLDNGTATASITVNRAPAITSANAAPFLVGTAGSFAVTTTGYPTAAITRTGTLPPGMTFTDNGNGTATLAGTPTAGGSFPLGLTANNGVAPNAAQTLTVTVGQAPAITSATTTTFMVGTAGAFAVTTSGQPTAAITETGTLPAGLTFVDNGNGTATLAGTPAAGSGGSYPLGLTAANGVNPNGTQTLTVTVTQATAITANPNSQAVDAGGSVSFIAAASGFPTPTVQWQRSTDGGASFTNIAGATSTTYTFTTAAGDNGNAYRAVFTNVAGTATSTAATLTVASAPSITSADHATFAVGTAGSFTVTTSGFPTPTLTTTGTLPAWLSFTDHGNGTATLAGTPPAGSGGTYGFTITADNGTAPAASQAFTLTVDASPTVTSADHATFQVGTAGSFTVTTSAGFPVATTLTKTGTLPSGVTFTDNGNGTATLAGTPAAGTAGSYPLTITATNGSSTPATQGFTLTVTEASAITSADHTTFTVGSSGSFTVTTSPVATTVIETGPLPAAVSFTDHGDGTATLSGTPAVGTGGAYTVTLQATNAAGSNSQTFTLTVNAPSAITSADRAAFTLGTAGSFTVTTLPGYPTATTITTTGTLPAGVRFTDNGDGTATIAGTPTAAGSFPITITASNGVAPDATQAFTLTVNQAPSITSADHATFPFGSAGSFTVTTTAGYPTTTTLTTTRTLPSGVTFTDNGDGTATLAGTPTAAGAFPLTIKASNGATTDATQPFTLTVTKVPTIGSADHTTFAVGSAGSFAVTTTVDYPTATTLTESGPLPSGVSFTDHGDGTATLAGTPATGTAGSYPLTLTVANTAGSTQQSFTLTVTPANASPAITSADHATFIVGTARTFAVTTTAGYPAATTIAEAGALPAGVTFADNGDGTATLAGTPAAGGGTYALTITAGNGATPAAIQAFTLTVDEAPAVTSADHATFAAGSVGSFTVIARGFPVPTLGVAGTLPAGVTFTDHKDGTATIAGTPAAGTGGTYALTITAANGVGSTATQAFTLTVATGDQAPPAATVTASATGGGTVSPAGATAFPTGTLATYSAIPAAGQLFLGWTLDGADVGFASPLTFTVGGDRTLVARFAARPAFADVAGGTPAGDAITQLAARGVIKGYGDGAYGPGDPVLRAQMAALIVRAFGWGASNPGGPVPFSDLGGIDPELQRAIAILAQRGIIGGYGDGTFGPTDRVLHVQVISFIARGMVQAGYWTAVTQDDPTLYPNVPLGSGHRLDLLTYTKYAGAIPDRPANQDWGDWATAASRGWTAQVLWQALASQFGVDRVP
jgi:hypothetical protein